MKYIIIFLVFSQNINGQFGNFSPRNLPVVPTFLVAGQSNGYNFANAESYNNALPPSHAKMLSDSLAQLWNLNEVVPTFFSPAGTPIAIAPIQDWNVNTNERYYEFLGAIINNNNAQWYLLNDIIKSGKEPDLKFIIWIQGENDAFSGYSHAYYDNLLAIIKKTNKSLRQNDLKWIIVGLNDDVNRPDPLPIIEAQIQIANDLENVYYIDVQDFTQTGGEYLGATNVHYHIDGLDKIRDRIFNLTKTF